MSFQRRARVKTKKNVIYTCKQLVNTGTALTKTRLMLGKQISLHKKGKELIKYQLYKDFTTYLYVSVLS